MIETTTLKLNQ